MPHRVLAIVATTLLLGCSGPGGDPSHAPVGTDLTDPTDPPEPVWTPTLDAILLRPDGKAFFFRDETYIRYDLAVDEADAGYPRTVADWWNGLGPGGVDAALERPDGTAWFFRSDRVVTYDHGVDAAVGEGSIAEVLGGPWTDRIDAAARWQGEDLLFRDGQVLSWPDGEPEPVEDRWPEAGPGPVDAALASGDRLYLFREDRYLRVDADGTVSSAYPRPIVFWWPGLWDPNEGTGHPGARLPADVADRLAVRPSDGEIAARRARVAASAVADGYVDYTDDFPLFVASVEDHLRSWGCGLLGRPSEGIYRFRCATDTSGPLRLDIEPVDVDAVDWSSAAYHSAQVSQGDFMADLGTPLSIFGTDDGTYRVVSITANTPTGSIVAGLNIRVEYVQDGLTRQIGWSHLNTAVPGYVLDAYASGAPLPEGRAFGFIGATGNLWIAGPPSSDGPYTGDGSGLPVPHSHLWFVDALADHERLSGWTRQAIDYSGRYPYGGG